jgi:hypothetical protein
MIDIWNDVIRLDKEARAAMPDSGQFAFTRETRALVERDAIAQALDFLVENKGWPRIKDIEQPDPPDAIVLLDNGLKVSVEFASITHQKTMQVIKHRIKTNAATRLYTDWTPETFQARLTELIATKEAKFAKYLKNGLADKPLLLVLGSDGVMSHSRLLKGFKVSSDVFDLIAVHLGYSPSPVPGVDGTYQIHIVTD